MKQITFTLFCVVILVAIFAGEILSQDDANPGQAAASAIPLPEQRLPEYERLTYKVKWLGIPVGTIRASIKGIEKIQGRDAYVLEVVVKTNRFCSAIYKIEDRFVSYLDVENLYTLRHEVNRREGRYRKDAVTDFDQENHRAHFRNSTDNSEKNFDIPQGVQDTLSACYFFMLLPLEVGERIEYSVCNNEKNYQLFGLIQRKTTISVPALRKKEVFYLQPYAKLKGELVRKGKVSGYFSCDKRRLPLLAIVRAPMLTKVTAYLTEIDYTKPSEHPDE
ncbi:DUF3108 domain-containing protein [Candidatus Omnitrophota bacterium]